MVGVVGSSPIAPTNRIHPAFFLCYIRLRLNDAVPVVAKKPLVSMKLTCVLILNGYNFLKLC